MSLTVDELAKLMNVRRVNIMHYINYGKFVENFFFKVKTANQEKGRGGQTIIKYRPMWCIDESKIDAFTKFWEKRTRERRPKVSNGKNGAERLAWTAYARECYNARMRCAKCNNNRTCAEIEKITHERKMKKTVIELVRELGIPPERII